MLEKSNRYSKNIIDIIKSRTFFDYDRNIASENEIEAIREKIDIPLDTNYLNFLRGINGFELNGLNFYGTREQPEIYVFDLLKQNYFWKVEIPKLNEYLIVGDGDIDFYCYSTENEKYYAFSKSSLTEVDVYENFYSFLEAIFKIY